MNNENLTPEQVENAKAREISEELLAATTEER